MADNSEKSDLVRALETFISNIAEKEGFKNFRLQTKAISTDGANYMADLYYVDVIEDGKETLNLFVKAANTPAHLRKFMPTNLIYQHEVFAYTKLADQFHTMEEKHSVPEEKRFKFPKYYGANLTDMEEMMAFENLAAQGFILYDRFQAVDWEYARAAVEEIAKFHARTFAIQKGDPEAFKQLTSSIPDFSKAEGGHDAMKAFADSFKKGIPTAMGAVESENKGRLQKYIDATIDTFVVKHMQPFSKYSTLIHSDYRASNIMVKYQGNKVVSLKPVDYQSVLYGCPLNDIIYFLFAGSDEEFRREHFDDYFEHYHNTLADHLELFSLDVKHVYPKSVFYFELKEKLTYGLEIALFILSIVLVDTKTTITIENMMNPNMENMTKPTEQYAERLNGIIRDFVRWGYFDKYDMVEEKEATTSTIAESKLAGLQDKPAAPKKETKKKRSFCTIL